MPSRFSLPLCLRQDPAQLCPWFRVGLIVVAAITAGLTSHLATEPEATAPGALVSRDVTGPSVPPPALGAGAARPYFVRDWVNPPQHTRSSHSSTICTLPSGDLIAVWYGGSREGGADVALFTSRWPVGGSEWSEPVMAMDRAQAQEELDRRIKKIGNAVVFADPAGTLWLVYVSVSMGGWSGSALNYTTSLDEGRTWSDSERLTVNPFFNLSSLVRNKPIFAADGRIGLPVYHEFAVKFPQILWLTPGRAGTVVDYRIRSLAADDGLIQPSLVPLGEGRVLMLLRDHRGGRRLHASLSEDNGWTWSDAVATDLPNPDAAVDAIKLRDGRILLAYNDCEDTRENLRVALSADEGLTWQPGPLIEQAPAAEFSYPNLTEDNAGRIHLTYTWRRERIRHVAFNVAWLAAPIAVAEDIVPVPSGGATVVANHP